MTARGTSQLKRARVKSAVVVFKTPGKPSNRKFCRMVKSRPIVSILTGPDLKIFHRCWVNATERAPQRDALKLLARRFEAAAV